VPFVKLILVRTAVVLAVLAATAGLAAAQQRPLVTEDPETIGAGRILLEAGLDYSRDVFFPVSGLEGNLLSVPTVGISIGVSSIAEIQFDGGFYRRLTITDQQPAPFTGVLELDGDRTTAIDDLIVATKLRLASETLSRPSIGVRFATRLPNASNESGLGRDTTDFMASLLMAKTVRSVRIVGNGGVAIVGDPTTPARQDDLLTFGVSVARAVTQSAEIVGEFNGRLNLAAGDPTLGSESQGVGRMGARYTKGPVRVDAAVLIGVTSRDPQIGFTTGLTWVFNAFSLP
jgi:hypothetical protein